MKAITRGAAAYFALVFGAGFLLGSVRTLVVAPNLGELTAVVTELPLILALSWLACGWVIRRFAVPSAAPARLAMGTIAIAFLLLAELGLSLLMGMSLGNHLESYLDAAGAIGLGGQLVFAGFPLLRERPAVFSPTPPEPVLP